MQHTKTFTTNRKSCELFHITSTTKTLSEAIRSLTSVFHRLKTKLSEILLMNIRMLKGFSIYGDLIYECEYSKLEIVTLADFTEIYPTRVRLSEMENSRPVAIKVIALNGICAKNFILRASHVY